MPSNLCRIFVASAACALQFAAQANGQSPAHSFITALQGKEVPIPADYVGKYQEQKKELLVTLDSLGLDQSADDDVSVVLVRVDGTTESQKANANGDFVFQEVSDGLGTLVVTGKRTYAAMALFLESLAAKPDATPAVPGELPPAPDRNAFQVPTISEFDPAQIKLAVDSSGTAAQGPSVKPLSFYKPAPASRFQVKLVNGVLQGRVVVPEDGYESSPGRFAITILKFGKVVGTTSSDAEGNFFVRLASSGVHSIVASGPAGHAAFSFDIIDGVQTAKDNWQASVKMVATLPQAGETLFVLVIPPRMMPAVRQVVTQAYPTPPSMPLADAGAPAPMFPGLPGGFPGGAGGGMGGGGMGGGGMGGGAGAGGLGGLPLGAILGIGGLAAGVAAISSNDEGFNSVPASIIVP